ncbi:MAG: HD domain-containing phosphohydrolase [Terriglobia bacterium]
METPSVRPRILVVDDDPAVAKLLCEALFFEGLESEMASNGKDALERLAREHFDGIISDLHMPGLSGTDLLESAHGAYPHVAFLMATGEQDVRVGIEAMKHGASDYILKPFNPPAVVASLRRSIQMKQMERELEEYRRDLERMVEARTKQLEKARQRIEMTYDETLEALGAALDLRDNETAGHSRRVTFYSVEMAKALGCSDDQLKQIARGAYLHDIGKIGIPDAILLKAGKLTVRERTIMESHVRVGYNLVSRVAFLAGAAEIVLTHQERYDGTGYPQGLTEGEIPLGARIFAAADTLDAMTSDRPYRRALPFSAAKEEITRESGRQFDPEVVRVFLSLPEEVWANIRLRVASQRNGPRKLGSLETPVSLGEGTNAAS